MASWPADLIQNLLAPGKAVVVPHVVVEGHPAPSGGLSAGARMPDARLQRDGAPCRLHDVLAPPGFHRVLCGPRGAWDEGAVARLRAQFDGTLRVHRIAAEPSADGLHDPDGAVLRRLGADPTAQYLVRPDGRCHPGRLYQAFEGLARGLAALHEAGFVHRDLRPDHGRGAPGRRAVLGDFGLVAGIDARGFLLGAAVATRLGKGVLATNAQLVERAVTVIENMGARVIGPDEVRKKLNLTKRAPL